MKEPDPQELLPVHLRDKWAVVPCDSLYQLFIVGCLIGLGIALSIIGLLQGPAWLMSAFPVAMGLAVAQKHVFPWSEPRLLKELPNDLESDAQSGGA